MTLNNQAFGVFNHSLPTFYVKLSSTLVIKKWFLEIRKSPGNIPQLFIPLCKLLKIDVIEVSQPLRSTEK